MLALVCDVLERHRPRVFVETREQATTIRERLLRLVEEDGAAYQAYLGASRGTAARDQAALDAATVPLEIARACAEVVRLARNVAAQVHGPMRLDVGTASNLAHAAAASSLDLAEENLEMVAQAAGRRDLDSEIVLVRAVLGA